MKIIKPRALQRGDVIGICSPASAPASAAELSRGIAYLERLGYRVELGKNLHRKRGYLAGTDTQRASDVNELFANRTVKAIFTARGGYGSHRILPLLNYRLIKRNPKIVVGYSDITALQSALLARAGLVTFTGPMVASDFSAGFHGNPEEWFWRCVTSTRPLPPLRAERSNRARGTAGRLIGGNLSVLAASVGTPYFPGIRDPVLLLEEVDERPYRIDRMLRQIRLARILNRARGIILGAFVDCRPEAGKPSLTLREVFADSFSELRFPVLEGVRYGHIKNSLTIPLGLRVRVDPKRSEFAFLDAAVS